MTAPPERIDWLASRQAYQALAATDLPDGWRLVYNGATIKAYQRGPQMLLAVRGTADFQDIRADFAIVANQLKRTDRYRHDTEQMREIVRRYPPARYTYFMTGHSLGSAVGMALQQDFPFIQSELFYNGAIEPAQLLNQPANVREIYQAKDPLLQTMGWAWRNKEVVDTVDTTGKPDITARLGDAYTAHTLLSFSRLYGGWRRSLADSSEDTRLAQLEATPLSDDDIRMLLGHEIRVFTYPELAAMHTVEQALDPLGRAIILFLTESRTSGHWIALHTVAPGTLEFCDPYGLHWDDQFAWLLPARQLALGQTRKELSRLLGEAQARGMTVTWNKHRFQSAGASIATCGRWCCARLLLSHLSLPQFADVIRRSGLGGDAFVTVLTEQLLRAAPAGHVE